MGDMKFEVPAGVHDSLRRAALKQAAGNLRQAAEALELAASDPGRVALADAESAAAMIGEDLAGLGALGYAESPAGP